jgi:hypothetical protein
LPGIALEAADKPLAMMLNLNHGLVAMLAVHRYAIRTVLSLAASESTLSTLISM